MIGLDGDEGLHRGVCKDPWEKAQGTSSGHLLPSVTMPTPQVIIPNWTVSTIVGRESHTIALGPSRRLYS